MSYKVNTTAHFDKEAKRLAKKYKSLKADLEELFELLETNPTTGIHLGKQIYKIRMAIKSKGKGKRSGARIMTFVKVVDESVNLFSIYSKGEKDDITDDEVKQLIDEIL